METLAWQDPVARTKYPHMLYQDTIVWTAFLRTTELEILRVAYDVKVGSPIEVGEDATAAERAIAEGTGCKRIDAVIDIDEGVVVVEVKPYGNHAALGQVIQYMDLFAKRYALAKPLRGMICCSEVDPDLESLAESLGLSVSVVDVEWAVSEASGGSEEAAPDSTEPGAGE